MKKIIRILMLAMVVSLFAIEDSSAQVSLSLAVNVRPHRPRGYEVRPARPSPRHVWISEEWVVNGGRYNYKPGYWAIPPQAGGTWVPGRWDPSPNYPGRYVWVAGHWNY